jgi:hypothetical protein
VFFCIKSLPAANAAEPGAIRGSVDLQEIGHFWTNAGIGENTADIDEAAIGAGGSPNQLRS